MDALAAGLEKLGLQMSTASVGRVALQHERHIDKQAIQNFFERKGFQVLPSNEEQFVSRIKELVEVAITRQMQTGKQLEVAAYLTEQMQVDYVLLSNLFLLIEGIKLEKYILSRKIDKIKEAIVYSDKPLIEIASCFGYKRAGWLSRQLKTYTGQGASFYKKVRTSKLALMKQS